jgi:2'-5' RNA ligase
MLCLPGDGLYRTRMSHRLFIGIRPPACVRDALLDTMEALDGARWVDEANLHLTLRFVGEVERPAANDLAEALGRIDAPRFELRVEGTGAFDRSRSHRSYPHAVWARVPPTPALEGLRQKVERACESAGLGRETRRYTPHITLARTDRATEPVAGWLAAWGDLAAGPWTVEDFILFESHLGRTGAAYREVARYPLRALPSSNSG